MRIACAERRRCRRKKSKCGVVGVEVVEFDFSFVEEEVVGVVG